MVRQGRHHRAAADFAARARRHHAFQLAFKRLQLRKPPAHVGQMAPRYFVDDGAISIRISLQSNQFADAFNGKAQFARMANEIHPINVFPALRPLAAGGAGRRFEKPDGFIIPNRGDLNARIL